MSLREQLARALEQLLDAISSLKIGEQLGSKSGKKLLSLSFVLEIRRFKKKFDSFILHRRRLQVELILKPF
jgi:hypothetical protein